MASVNKIIKSILNVNDVVIDNASLDLNERNEKVLKVHLHPQKKEMARCPICGCKCSIYDRTYISHLNIVNFVPQYLSIKY